MEFKSKYHYKKITAYYSTSQCNEKQTKNLLTINHSNQMKFNCFSSLNIVEIYSQIFN